MGHEGVWLMAGSFQYLAVYRLRLLSALCGSSSLPFSSPPFLLHSPYLASWNSGLNGEMASLQPGRMIHGLFDKDCRFINTCYDISSIHIFWREMFEKANNHKSLAIIKMPRKITQAPMTFCKIPDQVLSKLLSLLKPRKVWEEKCLLTTILK